VPLEGQQHLREFIAIGACGHHGQTAGTVDVDQYRRLLLRAEGTGAEHAQPAKACWTDRGVFKAAHHALHRGEQAQEIIYSKGADIQ
jgi:hypothetical protein